MRNLELSRPRTVRLAVALLAAVLLAAVPGVRATTLTISVLDRAGHPVEDAAVTAAPLDPRLAHASGETDGLIDQVDKTFVPYVTVLRVGTRVRFPNSDNIRHHVYSFSTAKRFELPLYAGRAAAPVLFDKVGVVVMGCNIHDWMLGYVYVTDAPYFGKTEASGTVQLRDLPAGDYQVRVWHPEMEAPEQAAARTVHVDDQGAISNWTIDRQASLRPRRAPVPGSSGY